MSSVKMTWIHFVKKTPTNAFFSHQHFIFCRRRRILLLFSHFHPIMSLSISIHLHILRLHQCLLPNSNVVLLYALVFLLAFNRKNVRRKSFCIYERSCAHKRVFVSTYAYVKRNLLCEHRMTIVLFDSDDDNGSNLFFGFPIEAR